MNMKFLLSLLLLSALCVSAQVPAYQRTLFTTNANPASAVNANQLSVANGKLSLNGSPQLTNVTVWAGFTVDGGAAVSGNFDVGGTLSISPADGILMTTANSVGAVTIGSGLAFDGTTLSAVAGIATGVSGAGPTILELRDAAQNIYLSSYGTNGNARFHWLTTNRIAVVLADGTFVNAVGTADSTTFLRGDGTLAVPSGGSAYYGPFTNTTFHHGSLTWASSNTGPVSIHNTNSGSMDSLVLKGRSNSTGGQRMRIQTAFPGSTAELDQSILFEFSHVGEGTSVNAWGIHVLSNTFSINGTTVNGIAGADQNLLAANKLQQWFFEGRGYARSTNYAQAYYSSNLLVLAGNIGIGTDTPTNGTTGIDVRGNVHSIGFTNTGNAAIRGSTIFGAGGLAQISSVGGISSSAAGTSLSLAQPGNVAQTVGRLNIGLLGIPLSIVAITNIYGTTNVMTTWGQSGTNDVWRVAHGLGPMLTLATNLLILHTNISLSVSSGINQRAGNATLVGGTLTVANTSVTANTLVMLSPKTVGGAIGTYTYTLSAGASFTINSSSGTDTSVISYFLIENP